MDPISLSIELELGALLIAAVGAAATWLHDRHSRARRLQREAHHRQMVAMSERHHCENLLALRQSRAADIAEESADERVLARAERGTEVGAARRPTPPARQRSAG